MTIFMYRCSTTGDRIQGFSAEDVGEPSESDYRTVLCTMCQQIHLVNPITGEAWETKMINEIPLLPFDCRTCGAKYQVIRVEAPEEPTIYGEIVCVCCGGQLAGRDGSLLLKYFLVERPRTFRA